MLKLRPQARYIFYFLLFLILFISPQNVLSQEQSEACKALPPLKDFYVIGDIKSKLQREVSDGQARIKELKEIKIPQTAKAEKDLNDTNEKIKALTDKPDKTETDQAQLGQLNDFKNSIENFLGGATTAAYEQELQKLENDVPWKEEQLRCINAELSRMLSPEQNFKWSMSAIFAALIGLVILGFFTLAYIDPNVRRAIFAGQAGLQFLTLFSIVIAIILFGITNILQDKELAALLGGLSGYILGRYNAPKRGGESGDTEGGDDSGAGSKPNVASRLASITVSPAAVSLSTTSPMQQLTATPVDAQGNTIEDPQGTLTLQWESSDDSIAKVNQSGLATYVGPGTCSVIAKFNRVSSNSCAITCT